MTNLKTTKIAIWSSSAYSEWDISDALASLRVTHTLDPRDKTKPTRTIDMGQPQPRQVHVTHTLKTVKPHAVNFIVASYGALSVTNIPSLPFSASAGLNEALKIALMSPQLTGVKVSKLTPVDYINTIAKPSLLNKIQTELLRIQPYSLRKEAVAHVLGYFNSRISRRTMMSFLNTNLRLDKLKEVVLMGDELKAAVAMLATHDAETIQSMTGVPSFDIMYLSSAGKGKAKKGKQ
jgi:hypothetical protein